MNITKEMLNFKSNWETCECGNEVPYVYAHIDEEGTVSCPECHYSWLTDIIKMYKEVLSENSGVSSEHINNLIRKKLAELLSVDAKDLDEDWTECFLIKP